MRYLTLPEIVELHRLVVAQSGGSRGIRDMAALQSAVAQPLQAFAGEDLYEGVAAKAAALGFFLATNHAFIDGNKRVAHAALEVTLSLNGFDIDASVDEQEQVMLRLAAGKTSREDFTRWVVNHARHV